MILQRIMLPSEDTCNTKEVFLHIGNDGVSEDYDGYFNLFYIEKRKKYTSIKELTLNLTLKGYSSISLMHDRDEILTYDLDHPEREVEYSFSFPYDRYDKGVFWFRLIRCEAGSFGPDGKVTVSGYYEGLTEHARPVRILVDICTYRREEYVLRNLRRIYSFLSDQMNRYLCDAMQVVLVDNGRTLRDSEEIQAILDAYPYITVIENRNTGGAGGFTRGMEEAISRADSDGLTHVLLMDDDATYDCEVFVRVYGLLSTLKPEYADITVGGAIWRDDYPYIQHASG